MPDASPSPVPVVTLRVSGPGIVVCSGVETAVPVGALAETTATSQRPEPPPRSSSVTVVDVPTAGPTSPSETELGRATTTGTSAEGSWTRPAPTRVGGSTPPPAGTARAVPTSAALISAGDHSGWRWRSSAAPPATCGDAMLVPEIDAQPPGTEDRIPTPGAATSGLARSESGVGPAAEKPAIAVVWPGVTAATVIAAAELPGDETEPRPKSWKSFPAATTGTTPAAAAASSASATTSRVGSISGSPMERLITSMPSATAASIAATSSGAFPSRPTPASVGIVSAL